MVIITRFDETFTTNIIKTFYNCCLFDSQLHIFPFKFECNENINYKID